MDRKEAESMIELPRSKSKKTHIRMSWIEPLEKGAKARIRVIVEEQYDLKESYETVRALLHDNPNAAFKMT